MLWNLILFVDDREKVKIEEKKCLKEVIKKHLSFINDVSSDISSCLHFISRSHDISRYFY